MIDIVVGTRPEIIKMAPVLRELRDRADVQLRLILSGQHADLAAPLLAFFDLTPDRVHDVMGPGGIDGVLSRALAALSSGWAEQRPDLVLVHGDTTTALGAALAAFHAKIPVGHVEAGLRTGDLSAPFPEEMNRTVIDRVSTLHFPPTQRAADALVAEGLCHDADPTGNTCVDALLWTLGRLGPLPERDGPAVVLATLHRREGQTGGLAAVAGGLARLAARGDVRIVVPVHPSPVVAQAVRGPLDGVPGVELIAPQGYPEFVDLMRRSTLIVTDSGGIQEEAPTLGIPVLVAREATERPEAHEAGASILVGYDPDRMVAQASRLLDDPDARAAIAAIPNPYGDGRAAARIGHAVLSHVGVPA